MRQVIRILLLDDHGLFRESLSRLLQAESDFRVVGNCATVEEALNVLDETDVDVALLDHDLGSEQGFNFLEGARSRQFPGRILMVTAGMTDADTLRAIEGGCSGIFLKHCPPAHLVDAIQKVFSGELWLDPKAVRSLVAGATGKSHERKGEQPLNVRERAVLNGVFEGLSNKEIAAHLRISESSVKLAIQQLFDKTGVRTRSQLVRIALERHSHDWLLRD